MQNRAFIFMGIFAASVLVFSASSAWALTPPALKLVDTTGDSITIDSSGAAPTCVGTCSTTSYSAVSGSGTVTWTGTLGPFTVTNAEGKSKPALAPPQIDLGLGALATAGTAGTLTMSFTDVGFDGAGPISMSEVTTVPLGAATTTYTSYVDGTNSPYGVATKVNTIGPTSAGGTVSGPGPTAQPFSMTNVETIVMASNSSMLNGFSLIATTPPQLTLACPASSGQAGTSYSSSLTANGGVPPYTFSIISGSLPPGLTLNPTTGVISGKPTAASTYSFTAQVVDSSGNSSIDTVTTGCTIVTCPTILTKLSLACASNSGQVGSQYNSALVGSGGVQPYTFSIISGSLPPGLTLNPSTGVISGMPTTPGPFSFTAQVVDSSGDKRSNTVTSNCTITINSTCVVPPYQNQCGPTYCNRFNKQGGNGKIWVHAHIGNCSGIPTWTKTTVTFTGVSLTLNGATYPLPDGVVTFDPAAPWNGTTTFDPSVLPNGRWNTTVNPNNLGYEVFFSGNALPVDSNFANGGQATFNFTTNSSNNNLAYSWQWSAGAYSYWPDNNQAQILPCYGVEHAGAPQCQPVKQSCFPGPFGGGGSSYYNSGWSGAGLCSCPGSNNNWWSN